MYHRASKYIMCTTYSANYIFLITFPTVSLRVKSSSCNVVTSSNSPPLLSTNQVFLKILHNTQHVLKIAYLLEELHLFLLARPWDKTVYHDPSHGIVHAEWEGCKKLRNELCYGRVIEGEVGGRMCEWWVYVHESTNSYSCIGQSSLEEFVLARVKLSRKM